MKKPKENRPQLSRNIQTRRKLFGLKQDDLAHRAGIGISTLKDIERGASSATRPTVEAIAGVLKCSIDDLYGEPKEPTTFHRSVFKSLTEAEAEIERLTSELKHPIIFAYETAAPDTKEAVRALLGLEAFVEPQIEATSRKRTTR